MGKISIDGYQARYLNLIRIKVSKCKDLLKIIEKDCESMYEALTADGTVQTGLAATASAFLSLSLGELNNIIGEARRYFEHLSKSDIESLIGTAKKRGMNPDSSVFIAGETFSY